MALRYSGSLTINVTCDGRGICHASISRKGKKLWSSTFGAPSSFLAEGGTVRASDEAAYAALSLATMSGVDVAAHAAHAKGWSGGWSISRTRPAAKAPAAKRAQPKKRTNPARKRPAVKRTRKAPKRRTAKR